MTLSWQWLKQYVTVRWTPQQAAERLTLAGLEVTDRRVIGDDTRMDCEVTPNRPDWLSHVGVARELAALTGGRLRLPSAGVIPSVHGPRPSITIKDRAACRRYVGLVIDGVTVEPSPAWLRQRLESIGVRSINNVVDVTNFVLHELGQPLHAFDADKLSKGRIIVRRSAAGESITTIDGTARPLNPSILVIADAERPVAVAGIMGGQTTEVTPATRRILLESAWFDPLITRRASRALGVASDSSYRFERGVDPNQTLAAARWAAALIIEAAGGRLVGGPVDRRGARRPRAKPIAWRPADAAVLGASIPAAWQRQRFERLGCRVAGSGARLPAGQAGWRVTPPSFRIDLQRPVDLLEELARLWGYDRLPTTLPRPYPSLVVSSNDGAALRGREQQLRDLLIAAGLDETMTYSLVSPAALQRLPWTDSVLSLRNPLSQDRSVLRPTLVVSALEIVARNLNRRALGVALFELGRVYQEAGPSEERERRRLIIALAGLRPSSWEAKPSPWTVFHAKGLLDEIGRRMGGKPLIWEPATRVERSHLRPWLRAGTDLAASRSPDDVPQAVIGAVNVAVADRFEIPQIVEVILAEVDWPALWGAAPTDRHVEPLPTIAPATRDFAILVDQQVTHDQIVQVARAAGGPLVRAMTLFDHYQGAQVPKGRKSLAYTVAYGAGDRTLIDAEIAAAHQAILEALKQQLGAELRS